MTNHADMKRKLPSERCEPSDHKMDISRIRNLPSVSLLHTHLPTDTKAVHPLQLFPILSSSFIHSYQTVGSPVSINDTPIQMVRGSTFCEIKKYSPFKAGFASQSTCYQTGNGDFPGDKAVGA